ncbi:MAG TPA: hypothetical protein VF958_08775 [Thermoanaerobaculia bacterium]
MQSSAKQWTRTLAAGLMSSVLFAGAAFGAEQRMTAKKSTASRRAATEGPRVVGFKEERTDSWLCEYVSPFFCSSIPTAVTAPQPGTTTTSRGRR